MILEYVIGEVVVDVAELLVRFAASELFADRNTAEARLVADDVVLVGVVLVVEDERDGLDWGA